VGRIPLYRSACAIPFTRGPLAHLLRNRFYIGEVMCKGEVLAGEQPAIVDRDLFDAIQAKLSDQANNHKITRMKSEALLAGRIFDDRGNRMTPSHVRKRGIKYRYYLSSALLQGQPERAGAVSRIPAAEIEGLVVRSVRDHLNQLDEIEDAVLISTHVVRIEVQSDQLVIELTNAKGIGSKRSRSRNTLKVPWHKTPLKRRREISCPRPCPLQTPARCVPRTAPSSYHQLPAGAAGSMSSSRTPRRMWQASRRATAAASARST
jgi:site-specific DNA recombinase